MEAAFAENIWMAHRSIIRVSTSFQVTFCFQESLTNPEIGEGIVSVTSCMLYWLWLQANGQRYLLTGPSIAQLCFMLLGVAINYGGWFLLKFVYHEPGFEPYSLPSSGSKRSKP